MVSIVILRTLFPTSGPAICKGITDVLLQPAGSRMVYKITVLGDGGVGKTALTVQFTMSSFVESYDPTIEDCYRKQWIVDDQPCLLEVLDTAGQEEYTALRDQWIRDGEGFLVVYAITSRPTFERVQRIVERVHRVKGDSSLPSSPTGPAAHNPYGHPTQPGRARIPIVVVGNKRDKIGNREISTEEGKGLANMLGCEFYETSARNNTNVETAFKSLVRQIKVAKGGYDVRPNGVGPGVGASPGGVGGGRARRKKDKKCVIL